MMMSEPEPEVLVVTLILMAVRDGYDCYRLRPDTHWYAMYGRQNGVELEQFGQSFEAAQAFPAVLAGLAGKRGWWPRFRRWVSQRIGGEEGAAFLFPVGNGSVGVEYRVRWARGVVAELDIKVAATDALAAAAHRELQVYVTPDPDWDQDTIP
jgi:hypothetical protein